MKSTVLLFLTAVTLFCFPKVNFAQSPNLGTTAGFVLFTTVGAVTNTGISQLTGNVGSNSGSSTGFGNVNGVMHNNDGASAQAAADLLIVYNQLNSTIPNFFPAPLLGNGQILNAGVYSISGAATMNGSLTLNAQGNPGAVFIFQIQGAFSTAASSKVHLVNGAQACNVFWKVEGLVSMAAGTTMRGTVIANNAAITMNAGDTLEGRALSTSGAITVSGVLAYTPIGCGSPILTGPAAPALLSTKCYAIFSTDGAVYNTGITHVTGDVGTNVGLTTGFNPLFVTGTIHPIPDVSTSQAAADLLIVYNYLSTLPYDIELLYPAQFGNNLVLTPHTYLLNAATQLTDTLYLNAGGDTNAVFVIKIYGALSTSTYSKVLLINGTKAKNVYWLVNGAVDINDYSLFRGTIVSNNGAIDLNTGVILEGRAFTTTGALSTATITATMPPGCTTTAPGTYSITGYIHYKNTALTPMNNVIVSLKQNNIVVNTFTSTVTGYYHFDNLAPGTYTLSSTSTKTWGGINASDALLILQHFTQIINLTGINLVAADVDATNYVNSLDALYVARRFVHLIETFPAGDWAFEKPTVSIVNANVNVNILALCFGDVNGSYLPPSVKIPATVSLSNSGTREIQSFEQFEVPVSTSNYLAAGAISLVINYPAEILDVTSVNFENPENGTLIYNTENGEIRIAWYNTKIMNLGNGETILRLGFTAKNLNNIHNDNIPLSLSSGSEIANWDGSVLQNVDLRIPKLIPITSSFDVNIFPNPTHGSTQFVYFLPEKGKVNMKLFDMLGKEVATLANEMKEAGSNSLTFYAPSLPPGVYICRLILSSSTQTSTVIRRLAIIE